MPAQLQYFDRDGRVIPLGGEPLVIGGRSSAIRVEDSTVTRQHARVFPENGRYWIEGLAGGEGVRVNGIPTERAALKNRDKVQIGGLEIEFFEW